VGPAGDKKDQFTLPKMLKIKGYNTAVIGKWHLGFHWPWKEGEDGDGKVLPPNSISIATTEMFNWDQPISGGPWEAGFDYYFGDDVPNFPPFAYMEGTGNQGFLQGDIVDIDREDMKSLGTRGMIHGGGPGDKGWQFEQVMPTIISRATKYIEDHSKGDKPYFLMFTTTSPHSPVVPTKEFQGRSDASHYGDYVIQTDDAIGQIIKALKQSGTFDDTLLIVTSDNGPAKLIRHLMQSYEHFSAGKLRGMKMDSWEGGHRIPFIASWPARDIQGGRKVDALISLSDLFSTIAGVVGHKLPENAAEDSVDIWDTLSEGKSIRDEMVYANWDGDLGLRKDHWVYLRNQGRVWYREIFQIKPVNAPDQLYNLNDDPGQKINVYPENDARVSEMEARLQVLEKGE